MRRRLAFLVLLPLLAAGPAQAGASGDPDGACRQEWADLIQLHSENGDPGSPVRALSTRWEATYDAAHNRAESATAADCGPVIEDFAAAWGALERFEFALHPFDPRADLRRAEQDRRHYLSLGDELSPALRRAFRVIRAHTPGAVRDLAPALESAADVDVRDPAEVRAFVRQAREVKRASRHVQRMRHAYRLIGDAELDEE